MLGNLLEVLSGKTVCQKFTNPTSPHPSFKKNNLTQCFNLMQEEKIILINIGVDDMEQQKANLGLVWTLILKYQIRAGKGANDTGISEKEIMKQWCNDLLQAYPSVVVKDFKRGWTDGTTLCYLCNAVAPESIHIEKIEALQPVERLGLAMDTLETKVGVEKILDPEDIIEAYDDKMVLTYVSLIRTRYEERKAANEGKMDAQAPQDGFTTPKKQRAPEKQGEEEEDESLFVTPTKIGQEDDSFLSPSKRRLHLNFRDINDNPIEIMKMKSIKAGGVYEVYMEAQDEKGKTPILLHDRSINVNIESPDKIASFEKRVSSTNGRVSIALTPKKSGHYKVAISIDDESYEKTEFEYEVDVTPALPKQAQFTMESYDIKAGETMEVVTKMFDDYGNPISRHIIIQLVLYDKHKNPHAFDGVYTDDGFQFNVMLTETGSYKGDLKVANHKLPVDKVFRVSAGDADKEKTIIKGFETNKWRAGLAQEISVSLFDQYGNPTDNNDAKDNIRMTVEDDQNSLEMNIEYKDTGYYEGSVTTNKTGLYRVTIFLLKFNFIYDIEVIPGYVVPQNCRIMASEINTTREYAILLRDKFSNILTSLEGIEIEAHVENETNNRFESVPEFQEEKCIGKVHPHIYGDLKLIVIINDTALAPFSFTIEPPLTKYKFKSTESVKENKFCKIQYPRCEMGAYKMFIVRSNSAIIGPYDVQVESYDVSQDKIDILKTILEESYEDVVKYLRQVPVDVQNQFLNDLQSI